ncbi:BTB POZ-like protein [Rutstroemia sp. NJR-2017a BBW]|nr:BTB POZ-like protein [Rutstroemia sp. NJR-2017a BBW]
MLSMKHPEVNAYAALPADEFASKIKLLKGPEVKIIVGPTKKAFNLHKRLLCASSPYFDRAFNGGFMEAGTQELHFQDTTIESFYLVVQFLYTGNIVLFSELNRWEDKMTCILQFFISCDRFQLSISMLALSQLKELLLNLHPDKLVLKRHIRDAMTLPVGRPARKLVVDACLRLYTLWMLTGCKLKGDQNQALSAYINEFRDFAADLLQAYAAAARARSAKRKGSGCDFYDPLSDELFQIPLYF